MSWRLHCQLTARVKKESYATVSNIDAVLSAYHLGEKEIVNIAELALMLYHLGEKDINDPKLGRACSPCLLPPPASGQPRHQQLLVRVLRKHFNFCKQP